jgi:hypothetical protein
VANLAKCIEILREAGLDARLVSRWLPGYETICIKWSDGVEFSFAHRFLVEIQCNHPRFCMSYKPIRDTRRLQVIEDEDFANRVIILANEAREIVSKLPDRVRPPLN